MTSEDIKLLMERETKRHFESITRVWYAEKEQGRMPYKALESIGQAEFGYTQTQAHELAHKYRYKVRKGKSSDDAMAEVKARWEMEEAA